MLKRPMLSLALLTVFSVSAPAQEPRPMPSNVVGTIGLDGTIDKFYSATHTAIVKTADGVSHVLHLTGRTAVHGVEAASEDPFKGLNEGSHVVVHYVVDGSKKTAVEIDRVAKEVATRSRVVVYYTDEGGIQAAHYFRRVE